jgi:hypothetical protein
MVTGLNASRFTIRRATLDDLPQLSVLLYCARGYEACSRYNDNPQAVFFYRKRLRN